MSNGITISEFLDGIQTPIKKLSLTELRQREELWRVLWGWLDQDVKDFLIHTGTLIRVVRRDYKGSVGELGQVKWEPKRIDVYTYERSYNYVDRKEYYERKTVEIDGSFLAWWEFISERDLAEEVDKYEVGNIPEEEKVT